MLQSPPASTFKLENWCSVISYPVPTTSCPSYSLPPTLFHALYCFILLSLLPVWCVLSHLWALAWIFLLFWFALSCAQSWLTSATLSWIINSDKEAKFTSSWQIFACHLGLTIILVILCWDSWLSCMSTYKSRRWFHIFLSSMVYLLITSVILFLRYCSIVPRNICVQVLAALTELLIHLGYWEWQSFARK